MGYALGRMEVLPYALEDSSMYCGHLVSVAVNSKYRGHGVAKHILEMLHENMVSKYYVNSASLFCRVSCFSLFPLLSRLRCFYRYQILRLVTSIRLLLAIRLRRLSPSITLIVKMPI